MYQPFSNGAKYGEFGSAKRFFGGGFPRGIVLDLDETVVPASEVVMCPDAIRALCYMGELDNGYTFVTGRPTSQMKERILKNNLSITMPYSTENGGVVIFSDREPDIERNGGSVEKIRDKIAKDYERGHNMGLYMNDPDLGWVFQPCDFEEKETQTSINCNPKNFKEEATQVECYHESCSHLLSAKARLHTYLKKVVYDLGLQSIGDFRRFSDSEEFVPKNVNKRRAMKIIADYAGIDSRHFASMGDNFESDWPMMEMTGLSIASKKADPELVGRVSKNGVIVNEKYGEGMLEACWLLGLGDSSNCAGSE